MKDTKKIKEKVREKLDVPLKASEGDENREMEKLLGMFLVENGYIKEIEKRDKDWGFVYRSVTRNIAISEKEMPHAKWEHCIFKMGVNKKTKEELFPKPGKETEKYRFLHEANHAYQEYLCHKESPDDPKCWYEKSLGNEIDSCYAKLFNFCFFKRMEEEENRKEKEKKERGLSVWGNVWKYGEKGEVPNRESEIATRAQEDANELVTMFIWHPDYFRSYMDYLSLNHENPEVREREVTREDLERKGLLSLSKEEVAYLEELVRGYVNEMKSNIKLRKQA